MTISDSIELIAIFLVFVVGIINMVITIRESRIAPHRAAIAVEIERWRGDVRKSIAEFCGFTRSWSLGTVALDKAKERELLLRIDFLRSYIPLSLNPVGEIEKKILFLLEEIPNYTSPPFDTLNSKINELHGLAQSLLKGDWEKAKKEAGLKA